MGHACCAAVQLSLVLTLMMSGAGRVIIALGTPKPMIVAMGARARRMGWSRIMFQSLGLWTTGEA